MPLDVLQITRVSKVFLAVEQGHIVCYARKGLSDNIDDNGEVELEYDIANLEADVEDTTFYSS